MCTTLLSTRRLTVDDLGQQVFVCDRPPGGGIVFLMGIATPEELNSSSRPGIQLYKVRRLAEEAGALFIDPVDSLTL